ncbi:Acyl carrier protein [Anatilimnocola aggregata]|uniref:Acyl carrier protein n=1 Tax=Anatilimnocola aggregata TaxID=2528021 RepID=A0A517Y5A6_9BACT|nr:Acyl carrier protein [Anatilimnocola aggregata]
MNIAGKSGLLVLCCFACTFGCGKQDTPPTQPNSASQQPVSPTTERICQIVAEQMGVNRANLNSQTTLGDLRADDLDFVELVMELEEEFDISISDEAAERMLSSKNWKQGMNNVTLAKLSSLVDEQCKLPRAKNADLQPPSVDSELPQVKVYLNPLHTVLIAAEQNKGQPLTQDEVLDIRDKAAFAMLSPEQAERFNAALDSQVRVPKLDPQRIWEDWQEIRGRPSLMKPVK